MRTPIKFYSKGHWLGADLYRPDGMGGQEQCALSGVSGLAAPNEILLLEGSSTGLAAAARKANPSASNTPQFECTNDTLQSHPEWVVDRIAPREIFLISSDDDPRVGRMNLPAFMTIRST